MTFRVWGHFECDWLSLRCLPIFAPVGRAHKSRLCRNRMNQQVGKKGPKIDIGLAEDWQVSGQMGAHFFSPLSTIIPLSSSPLPFPPFAPGGLGHFKWLYCFLADTISAIFSNGFAPSVVIKCPTCWWLLFTKMQIGKSYLTAGKFDSRNQFFWETPFPPYPFNFLPFNSPFPKTPFIRDFWWRNFKVVLFRASHLS